MDSATDHEPRDTCGDVGGRTADGQPCGRPQGWGRDASEGRCRAHVEAAGRVVGHLEGSGPPPPPDHLSEPAADRWRELNAAWVFSPTELILLEEALSAWDRVRACSRKLQEDGLIFRTPSSGNIKRNPHAIELDASLTQFRNCLKQLDLTPPTE